MLDAAWIRGYDLKTSPKVPRESDTPMIAHNRSVKERLEYGQKLRQKVKRSDHAGWDEKKRTQDPIAIILAVNRQRIPPLVPIKMARMKISPFGFYRGNVPVMAADLATLPP